MTAPKKSVAKEKFLEFDYNFIMSEAVGPEAGLTGADFDSLRAPLAQAHQALAAAREAGQLPFMDLPFKTELLKPFRKMGEDLRKKFENLVVLGIGGSALGSRAVFNALKPLHHNLYSQAKRRYPRLFVADNIDPESFGELLEIVDPRTTVFNVISKSGATAETMAQFMIVYDLLRRSLGKSTLKDHLFITTDPSQGCLRRIADQEDLPSFEIPPGVGGRFAVFTPVSLWPLAMVGINVSDLLRGAAEAAAVCRKPNLEKNPAYLFAAINYLMFQKKKRPMLVMMPYADSLSLTADWFLQLWAESLGKASDLQGNLINTGQTPVKALGATDQHSQLQLYMEGPEDKLFCFLRVESFRSDVKIPPIFKDCPDLAYLGGHTLEELLLTEQKATAKALARAKRPSCALTLPKLTPAALGYLMYTLEMATVTAGHLYNVNPLDQPGVETGKRFTYGLLDRPGFENFKAEFRKGPEAYKKYILG